MPHRRSLLRGCQRFSSSLHRENGTDVHPRTGYLVQRESLPGTGTDGAATLEEGKIQVTCQGKNYDITPGSQITYNTTDQKTEIKEVDTELYTSWKSGYYKFEQMSLQEIMSTLALWYDLNIFYQNPETKNIHSSPVA